MIAKGLLVRLDVRHGQDSEVEAFLRSALDQVRQEESTTAWFALRFGRSSYGIFDVFPDDVGREAHLAGPVARELMNRADALLTRTPSIQKLDVAAHKLPSAPVARPVTKGLLLTFKAKTSHEADVEAFLRDAQPMVEREPETTAWFAIRGEGGEYGIFDVFPDSGGRFAHLTGEVPRELLKNALTLLGSVPDPDMLDVLASKLPQQG